MKHAVLALAAVACHRGSPHVSIAAAAVLREAMPELVEHYRDTTGASIDVTYGASTLLADQVKRAVAHDGVVLAEDAALDELVGTKHVAADSRRAIASDAIVLAGPPGAAATFAGLPALPAGAKIAIGDPAIVPAGRYARTYLRAIGAWDAVQPRLVYGGDVAGVVALAARGTARVAIVYRTDVAPPLVILDAPRDAPVARIVGGVVAASPHADDARAFLDFLASPDGQAVLERHGFTRP